FLFGSDRLDPPTEPVGRFLDLVEAAVEAQPEMVLAAGAEGGAGRKPDIGAVDDVEGRGAAVADAVDAEEEVERPGRRRQMDPAGGGEPVAQDGARLPRPLDLARHEGVAVVERRHRAALQEGG